MKLRRILNLNTFFLFLVVTMADSEVPVDTPVTDANMDRNTAVFDVTLVVEDSTCDVGLNLTDVLDLQTDYTYTIPPVYNNGDFPVINLGTYGINDLESRQSGRGDYIPLNLVFANCPLGQLTYYFTADVVNWNAGDWWSKYAQTHGPNGGPNGLIGVGINQAITTSPRSLINNEKGTGIYISKDYPTVVANLVAYYVLKTPHQKGLVKGIENATVNLQIEYNL